MKKYYLPNYPSQNAFPISKSGYPYIIALSFVTLIFSLLDVFFMSFVFLFLTFFTCFFFRDPDRLIPIGNNTLVSPADGRIISVSRVKDNPYFDGECRKISIFMSIFNVHVNRVPLSGVVRKIDYFPGDNFSANLSKASDCNERNVVVVDNEFGIKICLIQVAGLLARRIICGVQVGERLDKGQRYGLICFGSRVDFYLPIKVNVCVRKGDRVLAGSSILGELLDVT